ncbi:Fe-S cluster assembly scaffold protein NifU [Halarsenatibacter silvermanii]|uniref:Nitrogen fixation protein NifU n=1 Tax=Halarsenatibacter silvermanii TaxID=321763 RepID=A0A1G9JQ82_9FIRM|nr:Fe-S cluster assembly scaffold protein NifU [Halarsenatibacter silvermanii]SDL39482.1 nitrogen fixation protein NifU [Halarsenatibacter silvermanii]
MYSDKVMDHFQNPRNMGKIEDADLIGEVGNPTCGDIMKIYMNIDDEEKITDIKFNTFGCGAAVATSSMVTELVMNKTLDEAEEISNEEIAESLDGLPPAKMHCSNLAADAVKDAIEKYRDPEKQSGAGHVDHAEELQQDEKVAE